MKINKQLQKEYISKIKEMGVRDGYKKIQNTIYKIENDNVIFVDFLIVNSERLIYRINIKKKSYDDIFWQIMRMEGNKNKSDSLRVNGAFVSPSILIADGSMELSENIDEIVEVFMQKTRVEIESFLEKNDVAQYIISNTTADNDKILQCLAYIDLNLITKAKELAEKQILLGNSGRFENEGKGFFELLVLYYNDVSSLMV